MKKKTFKTMFNQLLNNYPILEWYCNRNDLIEWCKTYYKFALNPSVNAMYQYVLPKAIEQHNQRALDEFVGGLFE